MVIGSHIFRVETQVGIAVALRQVAQNRVVGFVLLQDVEDVPKDRRLTHTLRHRHGFLA